MNRRRLDDGAAYPYEPTRARPVLYRWIPTVDTGSPLYTDQQVGHLIRPFIGPGGTTAAALAATTAGLCATEAARRPGARPVLCPQNLEFYAPVGPLFGNAADDAAGGPWAPPSHLTIYSKSGRDATYPRALDAFGRIDVALTAAGLPPPRGLFLDCELSNIPGFSGYGANFSAGSRVGLWTPTVNDARAWTEVVTPAGESVADLERQRLAAGVTYDDFQTAFAAANRAFNGEWVSSLHFTTHALGQGIYRAARFVWPWIACCNYGEWCGDNPSVRAYDPENPQAYRPSPRVHAGDRNAPYLYPWDAANGAPLFNVGETHSQWFRRTQRLTLAAVAAGSQSALGLMPWVSEPGHFDDGAGYTPSVADVLDTMIAAWELGAVEFVIWGSDYGDPHKANVESLWAQFKSYVALHS